MNVAPHWLVYDSFGFPKSGLKGGGTDGPLSPPSPPLPILPAPEKSEQGKTPEVLLQGDLESATSSSQEVAVVVPEIVQVLKPIEEKHLLSFSNNNNNRGKLPLSNKKFWC